MKLEYISQKSASQFSTEKELINLCKGYGVNIIVHKQGKWIAFLEYENSKWFYYVPQNHYSVVDKNCIEFSKLAANFNIYMFSHEEIAEIIAKNS